MQLQFPSNKSVELAFKVGIAGTSTPPQSVAVVLERGATAISFAATYNGEDWKAIIDNPGLMFGLGEIRLSVNVVLNNRLFTPMKSTAEIIDNISEPILEPTEEVIPQNLTPEENTEQSVEYQESKDSVPEITPISKKISLLSSIHQEVEKVTEAHVVNSTTKTIKKITAKDLHALGICGNKVEESVEILQPVKLQLLRSIEPGIVKQVKEKIVENKQAIKPKETIFKLKKTKIIFK